MATQRGRIIRDTNSGDGIFSISGQQSSFSLERHWKSDVSPKVEMMIDAEFDSDGTLICVRAVPEGELAKEQLARISENAQRAATELMGQAATKGGPIVRQVVAELGVPTLAALGLVVIGWFYLNLFTIHVFGNSYQGFTFYDLMKLINNTQNLSIDSIGGVMGRSAGFYGFLCFAALLAPVVPHFLKIRQAWLGYTAPLALMVATLLGIYIKMRSSLEETANAMKAFGGARMDDIVQQMASEMLKAVSLGMGFYIPLAAALFLAFRGTMKFLAAR